jgi:hypothetical protein
MSRRCGYSWRVVGRGGSAVAGMQERGWRGLGCALAVAGLLLGACGRGGDAAAPAPPKQAKKAARPVESAADLAVAEANRKMVGGVPVGSSTAPVDVRFNLPAAPVRQQPFKVELAVLPQAPAPVLHVDVQGGEGLSVTDPTGPVLLEKVQAGTVQRLTVTATSEQPGTRIIEVRVTLELPAGAESREFAFPVVVGEPAVAATSAPAPGGPAKPAR